MFEIEVTNNRASTKRSELLTKSQIGAQVQFVFNDHWTNMKKIAVFKRCGKTIDIMDSEWNGDIVTVPPEMTEEAGLLVHVGVYGVSEDGKRITPTLYAPLGAVALGAEPDGDPSTDPTLPVWAQIQAQIGDLSNLSTEDKTSLVAAINEAAKSGGGSGGKDGTGIESITYKGEDESGGNVYTVLLTDGTSYEITAPKGAKGDKGDTGAAGAPGKAATIQVGEVTTGAAGTPASVSNVGTDEAAIFDFTIPLGDKGADGADGADGVTPHIGDNGNWYIGLTDTGKPSRGETGLQGPAGPVGPQGSQGDKGDPGTKGDKGADGKSAYQYAQEGGYTGTETEFAEKLAQEQLTGTTNDLTPTQVYEAVSAGIPVKVQYVDSTYGLLSFTAFNVAESLNVIVSQTIIYYNGVYILAELNSGKSDNTWGFNATTLAQKTDIPTALPNPNAMTFTGAVTGTYNGSAPLSVKIPSAVTDDHINSLIDTKLGVIENGSY